jgi:protein-S-isoprenylcysteine O-methyltransferase Ste14
LQKHIGISKLLTSQLLTEAAMKTLRPILGSLAFLVIAPGTVAGLMPWLLTRWAENPVWLGVDSIKALGWLLLAAGFLTLLDSFARFALQGEGTPAPPFPTRRLVVQGLYRHVRNPMYVAVLALIIGQAFILSSAPLLAYAAFIWLAFHLFITGYEEPTLRRTFPDDYATYAAHVRRWLPRLKPWEGQP